MRAAGSLSSTIILLIRNAVSRMGPYKIQLCASHVEHGKKKIKTLNKIDEFTMPIVIRREIMTKKRF